jgi:hypothetical protein
MFFWISRFRLLQLTANNEIRDQYSGIISPMGEFDEMKILTV